MTGRRLKKEGRSRQQSNAQAKETDSLTPELVIRHYVCAGTWSYTSWAVVLVQLSGFKLLEVLLAACVLVGPSPRKARIRIAAPKVVVDEL